MSAPLSLPARHTLTHRISAEGLSTLSGMKAAIETATAAGAPDTAQVRVLTSRHNPPRLTVEVEWVVQPQARVSADGQAHVLATPMATSRAPEASPTK